MKIRLLALSLVLTSSLFAEPYAYETVDSWEQFHKMETPGGGLVQDGAYLRFFMNDQKGAGQLYFIDGNYKENGQVAEFVRYHYDFAHKQFGLSEDLDLFDELTYFTVEKKPYFAGLLHRYDGDKLAAQLYPQDVGHDDQLARLIEVLSDRVRIPGARKIFLATGEQQAFTSVANALSAKGMPPVTLAELALESRVLPLEPGEADGTVRLFPQNLSALTPNDIVVLPAAVENLPPVAAIITVAPQARVAPMNLRARELGIPNLRVKDAAKVFAPYANKRVHLHVTMAGYEIGRAGAARRAFPAVAGPLSGQIGTVTVITRIPHVTDVYGYFVAAHTEAGTEEGAATFLHVDDKHHEPTGWSPLLRLSPEALHREQVNELVSFARPIELEYCRSHADYYPNRDCRGVYSDPRKPHALAIEIDVSQGLRVLSVRPYEGK